MRIVYKYSFAVLILLLFIAFLLFICECLIFGSVTEFFVCFLRVVMRVIPRARDLIIGVHPHILGKNILNKYV